MMKIRVGTREGKGREGKKYFLPGREEIPNFPPNFPEGRNTPKPRNDREEIPNLTSQLGKKYHQSSH